MLRIATFNLENLFTRPTAMNTSSDDVGRQAIEDHAELNSIIAKDAYSDDDKDRLVELSGEYGFHLLNAPEKAVFLQKIRGQLFRQPTSAPLQVVAEGRSDWTGWFELRRGSVEWPATYNTGRVIKESNPDILITVEVEDRPTLVRFNEQVLGAVFGCQFPYVRVIDGNDERGIDVGILSRFPIVEMRSHVDDLNPNGEKTFSRDCPEYDIRLSSGRRVVVLPNHFKSKRNGDDQASQVRRRLQAERAHELACGALARSSFVLVGGDLNDTPDSACLQALFTGGFQEVKDHDSYPRDRPGTYDTGLEQHKIDHLIMSPQLFGILQATGIERRGSYHPRTWGPFDTVTKKADEASDHHLLWADVDLA